jgi:golgi phosphoprotein 3
MNILIGNNLGGGERYMQKQLYLHEELMLLALREETGTMRSSDRLTLPLGAAIVSELLLQKRIEIDPVKKKKMLVNLVETSLFGDPILDEAIQKFKEAKRRTNLKKWVIRMTNIKKLKRRIAVQLCRRGIVREDEDTVLLIFKRKIYPEVNPQPELQLVARLRDAIFGESENIDPRDAIIIALAHHAGLLRQKFDKKELKGRKKRIKQIAEGCLTAKAAKEIMDAVAAAVVIAAIIPAIAAGSSGH